MPASLRSIAVVLLLLACCSNIARAELVTEGAGGVDVRIRPGALKAALDAATRAPRFELRPRIEDSRWPLEDAQIKAALGVLKSAATLAGSTPSPRADALSLLAYMGSGNTIIRGPHRKEIMRLLRGFRAHRNKDSYQLLGTAALAGSSKDPMLDHLLASTGVCEAYYFNKGIILRTTAKGSLRFVEAALADATAPTNWSEPALLAALELGDTARTIGESWQWSEAIRDEVRRRAGRGVSSPLLMAAQLLTLPAGPERDAIATELATTTIKTLLPQPVPGEPDRVWIDAERAGQLRWIADALHAVGGPNWIRFRAALRSTTSGTPAQTRAVDREALAALTLAMEADFRLKAETHRDPPSPDVDPPVAPEEHRKVR